MKQQASKLDRHADALRQWFTPADQGGDGITLAEARARLLKLECSVSASRLSLWWQHQQQRSMQEQILGRITSGAQLNREVEKRFDKDPAPATETLIKVFKVLIMELSLHGQAQPQILKLIGPLMAQVLVDAKLQSQAEDRKLEERRVQLLETKAAKADQAEQVTKSDLTPQEKEQRMRAVFGLA